MFASSIDKSVYMWQMELILGTGPNQVPKIYTDPNLPILLFLPLRGHYICESAWVLDWMDEASCP